MAFTANPEDYTARGKIITPLKDRIGSEIRTHYPAGRAEGMTITAQEAWLTRQESSLRSEVPTFVAEVVEGDRVSGTAGSPHRQAVWREPAAADLRHRECVVQR